jgi:DNA repair exonuclease SbcCD ATPase subunit
MFKKLTLTNFKSVEHDVINFTEGLQVFRGNSEAGKSTRVHAIGYALFGLSALDTTLDETVTYDKPTSSLKVELEMLVDGVTYTISRGKSGAEIRYADQSVTGQTETKLFIERLLGVSAQLSTKLLFANQTSIRGVLEDGPTAAAALIENLANLGQIEVLVTKIQEQLPCGNTNSLSGQITDCMADLSQPEPLPPSEDARNAANAIVATQRSEVDRLKTSLQKLGVDAEVGRAGLAEKAKIEAVNAATSNRRILLQGIKPADVPSDSEEALAELRAAQADATGQAKKYKSSQKVFKAAPETFEGTRDAFYSAKEVAEQELKEVRAQKSALQVQAAQIKALHVNETTCGFCKKDLSSVPEVIANNAVAASKLATVEASIVSAQELEKQLESKLSSFSALEEIDRANLKLVDDFWQGSNTMPATYSWVGGEVPVPGADLGPKIAAIEKAWKEYRSNAARYQSAQADLETLVMSVVPHDDKWQLAIDAEILAKQLVKDAEATAYAAGLTAAKVDGEYIRAKQAFEHACADRSKLTERLAYLKEQLAEMSANNELVKKLRAARPIIANKLWVAVLGAVGHYFSQIRGSRSIISKDETGFKCDGRSVAGLSGSTKDSLGLALRLALVKTFVPTASFISLDEPASGCDATRELAMLGVVAGAGFEQTLLVTHSDLADSFASQVIRL